MVRNYLNHTIGVLVLLCLCSCSKPVDRVGEWRSYGSDYASTKFTPLDQIHKGNVQDLQVAWRWESPDSEILKANPGLWTMLNEATPLMVGGVIYTSTSLSQVAAIDAFSGETIWVYDPETYKDGSPANVGFVHRGVAYWEDGEDRRILYGTGDAYLIALDAGTGKPIPGFGEKGRVDLTKGLRRPIDRELYAIPTPPVVCRDMLVVGSTVLDAFAVNRMPDKAMPPGDVRGFDIRTGQQRWVFHSVPQDGEFANETWEAGSWKTTGNTNVWTLMSSDEALGYVYLPFSTPTNDYYGGHRPGDNLFAESLVCLNAETGKRVWHFQILHHGLWDYDLPAAPNLVDISIGGREVKAVAQVTKQGFCFVFDRVTGEPIWPIEERVVPQSTVHGEKSSPTQPFPTNPLPFDRQGLTHDDLIDFTPELRKEAIAIVDRYAYGPLFSPPTEKGTIIMPGIIGGASWAGAGVNPETGVMYVPSYTLPVILTLTKSEGPDAPYAYTGRYKVGPDGPRELPIIKPPYGRITAIDLNTGEQVWMSPVGDGPKDNPAIQHLDLPRLGWDRRTFVLLTKTLEFGAQQGKASERGVSARGNALEFTTETHRAFLRAFDPDNGDLIAEIPLPGNATGAPITYMRRDKQFIAIPIGGASQPAELVGLTMP